MLSIKEKVAIVFYSKLFSVGLGIVLLPYLSRSLSVEDYGTYGQVILIVETIKSILTLGFSQILYRFFNDSITNNKIIFSNAIFVIFIVGFIGCISLLLSSYQISQLFNNPKLVIFINLISLSVLFDLLVMVSTTTLMYFDEVKKIAVLSVFFNLLKISLMFVSINVISNLQLLYLGITLTSVLHFVVILKKKKELFQFRLINLNTMLNLLKTGIPLGLISATGYALIITDGFIVSKYLSVSDYAYYRNGAIQIPLIPTFFGAVTMVLLPNITKLLQKNLISDVIDIKRKISTQVAALTFPLIILTITLSQEIIVWYLSEKYINSAIIFATINIALFFSINDYEDILTFKNKTYTLLRVYILGFIINLLLCILLTKHIGLIGAAISTLVSCLVILFVLNLITTKMMNITFFSFFDLRKLFLIAIVGAIIPFSKWISGIYLNSNLVLFLTLVSCIIVYILIIKMKLIDKKIIHYFVSKLSFLKSKTGERI
ncbi:MAG: oligosaccharide flippase family protein [Bacteroidetes bacterium]|nr:oligosaccharide flippase family protein [Bacteroidota bacterium]